MTPPPKKKKSAAKKKTRRSVTPRRKADQKKQVAHDALPGFLQAADDAFHARMATMEKIGDFIQKSHIDEYVALVNKPLKMLWLYFLQGLGRGIGFFFGTLVLSVILAYVFSLMINAVIEDVHTIPLIGEQVEEFFRWILHILDRAQQSSPNGGSVPPVTPEAGP